MQLPIKQLRQSGASDGQVPTWSDALQQYVPQTVSGGGGGNTFVAEPFVYADTTNKVIGPLSNTPANLSSVSLFPITGLIQKYTQDYTVRLVIGGSAPGYYICLSPTSTPPGGGSFSGSSNPATGIDGNLDLGDDFRVLYPY